MSDVPIDPNITNIVADDIGLQWRDMGRRMGFTEAEIDVIQHDRRDYGAHEMAKQVIKRWMETNKTPTIDALNAILCDLNRNDICRKIRLLGTERKTCSAKAVCPPASSNDGQTFSVMTEQKVLPMHKRLVASKIGKDWRDFGEELGFSHGELDNFKGENKPIKDICSAMLDEWVEKKRPLLSTLIQALKKIGYEVVANEVLNCQ